MTFSDAAKLADDHGGLPSDYINGSRTAPDPWTESIGIVININVLGFSGTVSGGFVWDSNGGFGMYGTAGGGGVAGLGVSGGLQYQTTNASNIEQLDGPSVQMGVSTGALNLRVVNAGPGGGFEWVTAGDRSYQGRNWVVGGGAGIGPGEFHVNI
ncbi:MAG: hypothetical protein ACRKGH_03520 [Dehalogenimonas sp.]